LEAITTVENLQLADLQTATASYYKQAADFAVMGAYNRAFETIERGLAAADSPQLHLLAALLHRQLGDHEAMRRHVAAIPMDDILRTEGEWLLREHQRQMQRQSRPLAWASSRYPEDDGQAESLIGRFGIEPPPISQPRTIPGNLTREGLVLVGLAPVFAALLFLVWWQAPALSGWVLQNYQELPLVSYFEPIATQAGEGSERISTAPDRPTEDDLLVSREALPTAIASPETSSGDTVNDSANDAANDTPAPPDALPAEAMPTEERPAPPQKAAQEEEAEPSPAQEIPPATQAADTPEALPFDLAAYFRLIQRADLAQLDITAQRQGSILILSGVLPTEGLRAEIRESTARLIGITGVDDSQLVVERLARHVVQEGETLWEIAVNVYNDGQRWRLIHLANLELLGNPPNLIPGMELTLP
jgi:nucleoid-associated protein YgaU